MLAFPFGGGYYIWKPYVIQVGVAAAALRRRSRSAQNALRTTNADIMVYCDACSKIVVRASSIALCRAVAVTS